MALHPEPTTTSVPPNSEAQPEEARYIEFQTLPEGATWDGKPALNKYSSFITNKHDYPGAKVRYASTRPQYLYARD